MTRQGGAVWQVWALSLLVLNTVGCAAYTMRTLPVGDPDSYDVFIVPPGPILERYADGWSRRGSFTPIDGQPDKEILEPLGDRAPRMRLNPRRGWIVFEVPRGGYLLPRYRTLALMRSRLSAHGIGDADVESSGIARTIGQIVPQEVHIPIEEAQSIELQPGFRLRVERGGLVMDNAALGPANWWTRARTVAGSGETTYAITTTPEDELSFEPLLSGMRFDVSNPLTNEDLGVHIVAISADLDELGMRRRFWRVVYPQSWLGVNLYVPDTLTNPVLVGANSRRLLDDVSTDNVDDQCQNSAGGDPYLCAILAGRAVLIPEVSVTIRGERHHVSFGTTVRTILQEHFNFAQLTERQLTHALCHRLTLARQYGTRRLPVRLDMRNESWLDIRLQHGDELSW